MQNQNINEKHPVELLSEDLLDASILEALGFETAFDGSDGQGNVNKKAVVLIGNPARSPFLRSFTREWELGGRLIETYRIGLKWESNRWVATFKGVDSFGVSPLIAAARVLVKYSHENEMTFHKFDKEISRNEAVLKIFQRPF